MQTIRVLLIDGRTPVRAGIAAMLESLVEFSLVTFAGPRQEAITLAAESDPDLLLIEWKTSRLTVNWIDSFRQQCPQTRLTLLGDISLYPAEAERLAAQGVAGYISLYEPRETIVQAIRIIGWGGNWFSQRRAAPAAAAAKGWTAREMAILRLILLEKTDQEIAQMLAVSERTVRNDLAAIYARLGVETRVGAAVQAVLRLDLEA